MSLGSLWTAKKSVWTQQTLATTQASADMPSQPETEEKPEGRTTSSYRPIPVRALIHKLGEVEEEDRERRVDPIASMLVGNQKRWLAYEEEVQEKGYPVVPDKYTTPYYKVEEEIRRERSRPHVSVKQLSEWITGIKTTGNIAPRSTYLGPPREHDVFTKANEWIVGHIVAPSYHMQRSKNPLERLGGMFGEVVGGLALGALGTVESYFKPYKTWKSLETMYRHPLETAYYLNTPLGRASIVGSIAVSTGIGWLTGKLVSGFAKADIATGEYTPRPVKVMRTTTKYSGPRYRYIRTREDIVGELVPATGRNTWQSGVAWQEKAVGSWRTRTIRIARRVDPLFLTKLKNRKIPAGKNTVLIEADLSALGGYHKGEKPILVIDTPLLRSNARNMRLKAGGYRIYGEPSKPFTALVMTRYKDTWVVNEQGIALASKVKPEIARTTYWYHVIDEVKAKPKGLFGYELVYRAHKIIGHVYRKGVAETGGLPVISPLARQRTHIWEIIDWQPTAGPITLEHTRVNVPSRFYPFFAPPLSIIRVRPRDLSETITRTRTRTNIASRVKPREMEATLTRSRQIELYRTKQKQRQKTIQRQRYRLIEMADTLGYEETPLRIRPPRILLSDEHMESLKRRKHRHRGRKKRKHRIYAEYVFRPARLPQII